MVNYSGGLENTQVWFYTVNNGPHDWPGWYNAESDMNASQEIWNFMDRICNGALSVSESEIKKGLSVYPNPTSDEISILLPKKKSGNSDLNVFLFDASMQLVSQSNDLNLNLSSFRSGIYFIQVKMDQYYWTGKIVKE